MLTVAYLKKPAAQGSTLQHQAPTVGCYLQPHSCLALGMVAWHLPLSGNGASRVLAGTAVQEEALIHLQALVDHKGWQIMMARFINAADTLLICDLNSQDKDPVEVHPFQQPKSTMPSIRHRGQRGAWPDHGDGNMGSVVALFVRWNPFMLEVDYS